MLPNGFTRTALAASLLLGTSALAFAQTHPGEATAPANPAASSAPASPNQAEHRKDTQAEPNKAAQAAHQKGTQAEPNKAAQAEPQKTAPNQPNTTRSSQAEPNKAGAPRSSEAKPNEPNATRSSEANPAHPGSTRSTEPGNRSHPTAEATPNRAGEHPNAANSGSSTEPGRAPNGAGENRASSMGPVNLTVSQRTEIHNTIINDHSAPRASNLSIDLAVGVAVPTTVRFAPLPPRIVEIEPEWRGYDYFVYNQEIVIIEPGTRRVVAIIVS